MTSDVHEIFKEIKLEYIIDGGTVLGSLRHGGLIPWDDDVDLLTLDTNEPKFLTKAVPMLKKRGYDVVTWWFGGYRIFPVNGDNLLYDGDGCTYPFIDLFFVRLVDPKSGKLEYITEDSKKYYGDVDLTLHDIRPVKLYKFGNLQLYGPRNATGHMSTLYGADWLTTVYESFDHRTRECLPMIKVRLREFKPALPSWCTVTKTS